MRRSLAVMVLLLMLPLAVGEQPDDAATLWTEQYGGDLVQSVVFSPQDVHAGELPAVAITFASGHDVVDVSGQYCRIEGDGGPVCFRAGLSSTVAGATWTIDLTKQDDGAFPIPPPEEGERNGVQFFITRAGQEQIPFPKGLPQDHPWFLGTEEEFVMWDETQYFGFDVQAAQVEPVNLAWLPWVTIPILGALGAGIAFRTPKTLVILLVAALAVPAAITLWDESTQAAKAPDFTLTDTGWENDAFRGPQSFSLSDFEGQTVVIDFMAYNCGSCRFVTPQIMEPLWEEYGHRDDFTILTIDVGEFSNFPGSNTQNLIRWQTEEFHGPWIHALDDEGIFLDYVDIGAFGLPSVFILDGDRNVVFANTGIPSYQAIADIVDASLEGNAQAVDVLTVGVLGLALVAGVSSFFAPCSVGLIPAYMGFLLQRQNQDGKHHSTIPAGLATAAGIVAVYAVLALILWLVQDALTSILPFLGPVMGGLLIVLGILMLVGFDWERVAKVFGMGKVDGRRGFFAFGVGYGLAAFGCTGPIFLPVLIAAFAQGTVTGFLAFVIYTLAVSSLVVFAAYLVGAGQQTRLRTILSKTKLIMRISAVLLIAGGAYLIWFDFSALSTKF